MKILRSLLPAAACLGLLVVVGCTVGPDYEEPDLAVPDAWENAAAADLADSTGGALETWWTAFDDTLLDSLIVMAREASPDLAVALGRIGEARAFRQIAGGERVPNVDLDGSFSRTEIAELGPNGAAVALGAENPVNNWEFGLGAAWEVDVFGRVRRTIEAADADVAASIEDYRDVMVTLYAGVASTYVEVRTLQEQMVYAEQNAASQQETLELVEARLDAGLVPALDVARARSNLANTLAQIPTYARQLEAARNELAILVGRFPGSLDARLETNRAVIPSPALEYTAGLPAELLRRRPDVRRQERDLAAQNARIGVATAELYPSFGLAGSLTLQASEFGDLGQSGSWGWSFSPFLRWNIFSGGRVRGQIKLEEARTQQALALYEKTVLRALAEVENAMVAVRQEEIRVGRLETAVEASQESVELVHTQYMSGLTDFQSYLDAQRSLTSQQNELALSRGLVVGYLISLNRALGGGWSLDAAAPDLQQTEDVASPAGPGAEEEEVNE